MLEEEINLQKSKTNSNFVRKDNFQPIIKIPVESYIPEDFINDVDLRLSIYKRISNINNKKEIEEIKIELIDRFGKLPKQLINLLKLVEIKIICLKNNIEKFEFSRKGILISFFQNKPKNPEKLLELSLSKNSSLILRPDQKIFYDFGGNLIDDRFELSKNVINLIK